MKSRKTHQKELLKELILKEQNFFTAEILFKQALNSDPRIGIATVFRFLTDLRKRGEIHAFMCGKSYIYSCFKKSHCHFTCSICNQKKHFALSQLGAIQESIPGVMCHFTLEVEGVCESCSSKQKR
jgi:Fe2+ or Zn2+ uptake regulation protein